MTITELLDRTTTIYRPGPEVTEMEIAPGVRRVDVWLDTPPETERPVDDDPEFQVVDMHFFRCAVNKREAELLRGDFYEVMANWPPDPTYQAESRLDRGPSYIELGAQIGTVMGQQDAMRLMALGAVLGCWEVVTPEKLVGTDPTSAPLRERMAGRGLVMVTPYRQV